MNVRDWRDAPSHLLAPIFESERQQWLRQLQWDPAPGWAEVERARTTWGLPGLLAIDGTGRVRGTVFYMQEGDRIDLGGMTSDHVDATDALIEGVMASAAETRARVIRGLLFDRAVALNSGLAHRRFDIEPHLYLSCPLDAPQRPHGEGARGIASHRTSASSHSTSAAVLIRPVRLSAGALAEAEADSAVATGEWRESDVTAASALLRRAYDPDAGALFAPRHEPAEWERYVRNLVEHAGCGTLNADATSVCREGAELRGLALVTDISPKTAHIVQLAVDPSVRGRQLGARLVEAVCARLAETGYRAVTLLVAQGNQHARALYHDAGFRHDATFLAATHRLA